MPRAGIAREFPRSRTIDWSALFRLKQRWRVSVAALIRRGYDFGLLDAVKYRQAYKQMSMNGWLKQEPDEFEAEPPELVPLSFNELQKSFAMTSNAVAVSLCWTDETFAKVAGMSASAATDLCARSTDEVKVTDLAMSKYRLRRGRVRRARHYL